MNDRKQTVAEHLDSLQSEYIVAQIRSKIYSLPKDKKYYERVMLHKKDKIEAIASINNLPTIFTDNSILVSFNSKVIPQWGIPNFIYKNEAEYIELRDQDIKNYFPNKSNVNIRISETDSIAGIIIDNSNLLPLDDHSTVQVRRKDGEVVAKLINHISRIF